MERCPHCKAPVYGVLPWTLEINRLTHKYGNPPIRFPMKEAEILLKFLKKYPDHVHINSIIYGMWAERNLDEPQDADNVARVYISKIRKRLKSANLIIKSLGSGCFKLEKVNG